MISHSKNIQYEIQPCASRDAIVDIMPTVVILYCEVENQILEFNQLIQFWLSEGAVHFVTIGVYANKIEDAIDWIIVEQNNLNIITTSHPHESPQEVLEFILISIESSIKKIRVVFVCDKDDELARQWKGLIGEKIRSDGHVEL